MGAGTNVQDRLVAVHHLDVGWKPSDMTQRNGRIIRQGNRNKEVQVYNYVTEGTFDAYLFVRHVRRCHFNCLAMTRPAIPLAVALLSTKQLVTAVRKRDRTR